MRAVRSRAVRSEIPGAFICKLCRSTEIARSHRLQRHTKNPEPFMAATCARCGLFQDVYDWQEAARAQESLKLNLVDTGDPLWDSDPELAAGRAKGRVFATALDDAGLVRGKRILDIGCGNGHFLSECLALGASSVTGQEFFRSNVIAYATNELSLDDIRSVPFEDRDAWPDAEFDVVCSFDVIEHIHDLAGFFEDCIRVAKPTGALFHATPGSDSLTNRLGRVTVSSLGRIHRVRTIGTMLCNLQPVDNFRGGAHVSLLGRRSLVWLVSRYPLVLVSAGYTPSYTYTNEHYATLVPGLNRLPLPVGSAIFGALRHVLRNKLVFLARKSEPASAAQIELASSRAALHREIALIRHRWAPTASRKTCATSPERASSEKRRLNSS
jgi:2-polyprenyl-3-methyl-5-hydroxy-6-metoxy-1,4-benzoquinol methylase